MTWFYAANDQEVGPVSDADFDQLIRSGQITRETLVWREGMSDWQPYAAITAPPPLDGVQLEKYAPAAEQAICSLCTRAFPTDDMIIIDNAWICAACKPLAVQKIKEGGRLGTQTLWQSNKTLVMHRDTELPARCVKCNMPTDERLRRQLYWHHPLYYLCIFIHLFLYVIVALIVRKRAKIEISLCTRHKTNRYWAITAAWLLVIGGIACVMVAYSDSQPWWIVPSILLLLGGVLTGAIKGSVVRASKIDAEYIWLKGTCPQFREHLPEWPG